MRVFAPAPFRWTDSLDYPYGYFDVPDDSKARAMKSAAKVFDDPGSAAAYAASLVSGAGNVAGLVASTSAAAANTALLQAALNIGGLIQVPLGLGDIYVTPPGGAGVGAALTIYRNTRLVVGQGSRIRLAPGANCNMIRNANWASPQISITQLSTPDAGITVVAQSATLPAVGSYVIILGATPRVYNNAYRVLTSGGGQFTAALSTRVAPAETPTTPATGATITWMQADENITIEGEWNYDALNQTVPDTWQQHAIYLRRLVNFKFDGAIKDTKKYALAIGNVYQSSVPRCVLDTISDGVHIIGSWDDVHVGVVQGKAGDDMVVAGQSDYNQYINDGAYVQGDGGTLKVDTILPDGSLTAFKYYGVAAYTCKSIIVGSVQGRISGGSGFVNLINDSTSVGATSSSLEHFELRSIRPTEAVSTAIVQTAGAITVDDVYVGRISGVLNNAANARPLLIGLGSTVNNFRNDDFNIQSPTYAGSAFGIYVLGTLKNASFGKIRAKNIGLVIFYAGSSVGNKLTVEDRYTENCGQFYKNISATSQTIAFKHQERNGYQASPDIELSNTAGGITCSFGTAVGLTGTDAFGGSGNNKVVLYSPQVGIDVGTVNRQAGALVYHNSVTARGSLVANNLVVCDNSGAANSWKQVSNTANTY